MSESTQDKIVFFLLNFLALEGAKEHYKAPLPQDNEAIKGLYKEIMQIGFPHEWDDVQKIFDYTTTPNSGATDCEKCWSAMRIIRNNLFHANKAVIPDPKPRLYNLLDWALKFIRELLSDNNIGRVAAQIKQTLEIQV